MVETLVETVTVFLGCTFMQSWDMKFTWDDKKRLTNLRVHRVDFADAVMVFIP